MSKRIVYAVGSERESGDEGIFANYFYLHGEAETQNGFDLCTMNGRMMASCMTSGIYRACLINEDKSESECLVFSMYHHNSMRGYVVLLDDMQGLEDALRIHNVFDLSFTAESEWLTENHPDVRALMQLVRGERFKADTERDMKKRDEQINGIKKLLRLQGWEEPVK